MAWLSHSQAPGVGTSTSFLGETQSNPQPPSTTSLPLSTRPQHVLWGLHIQSLSALRPLSCCSLYPFCSSHTGLLMLPNLPKVFLSLCFTKLTPTTWLKIENSSCAPLFSPAACPAEISPPSHSLRSVVVFSFLDSFSQLHWNLHGGLEQCPAKIFSWVIE